MSLLLLLRSYAAAVPPVVASTGAVARWSGNSGAVAYPSGIAAGNLLVLGVVNKFPTNGPATPSGWTIQAQSVGGSGTNGDNSGQVYISWFTKEATGSESGTLTVTTTGATTVHAFISRVTGTAPFGIVGATGTDSTDYGSGLTTQTVVSNAALGIEVGDLTLVLNGHNYTSATDPSAQALSASGATFSAGAEFVDVQGDDGAFNGVFQRISASSHACTAGSSSATATFTCTNGLWYVLRGGATFLRIRSASGGGSGAVTGTLSTTLGALTSLSSGVVAVQGMAAQTLGALTGSAAGVVPVVGSANVTLDALTAASAGVVGSSPITGTLTATLGALTGSAAGVVAIRGSLAATLGGLTSLSSGVVAVQGSAAATLGALTGASAGVVPVVGSASATLGALTGASTGVVGSFISGALSATLEALTGSATGVVPVTGFAAPTLGALTGLSSGVVRVAGALDATLGPLTGTSAGAVRVAGAASVTLDALTGSSAGVVRVQGAAAPTLGALTASATGRVDVRGTLAGSLGALTAVSSGSVQAVVGGTLTATLGPLTGLATGVVTVFLPVIVATDIAELVVTKDASPVGAKLDVVATHLATADVVALHLETSTVQRAAA